eukprot:8057762-Alexandrium_andersonii.AAC.1
MFAGRGTMVATLQEADWPASGGLITPNRHPCVAGAREANQLGGGSETLHTGRASVGRSGASNIVARQAPDPGRGPAELRRA